MIEIIFYNKNGSVSFGGGTSNADFKIIKIDGIGLNTKSYSTANYQNSVGQEIVSECDNPRTITISGDFFLSNDYKQKYADAISVLNEKGTLEIRHANEKRCISARCTEFLENDRQGKYMPFVIQFLCENPYFESANTYETPLYLVVPNLNSNFTFPAAFSTRISKRNIFINSNAKTEPVFVIDVGKNPQGELEILNSTSGERLKINYDPLKNECITVDVKNRKIYNQNGKNLINFLADDSFFDGFFLYPGSNECEVHLDNDTLDLQVFVRYKENFLEAVF